jgi:predicted phosphoribosyltransferase
MLFRDRTDGGRQLAAALTPFAGRPDVLVLALPRGGVPVAFEVARALGTPLDVFLVRKLGTPGRPELAMGALASGGVRVLSREVIAAMGVSRDEIDATVEREWRELDRRERAYRGERSAPDVRGLVAIVVDDGLATGATMRAAVAALRREGAARIIVAVPVAARETVAEFRDAGLEVVCVREPDPFLAVAQWYDDFSQTTDADVRTLLARAGDGGIPHDEPVSTEPRR